MLPLIWLYVLFSHSFCLFMCVAPPQTCLRHYIYLLVFIRLSSFIVLSVSCGFSLVPRGLSCYLPMSPCASAVDLLVSTIMFFRLCCPFLFYSFYVSVSCIFLVVLISLGNFSVLLIHITTIIKFIYPFYYCIISMFWPEACILETTVKCSIIFGHTIIILIIFRHWCAQHKYIIKHEYMNICSVEYIKTTINTADSWKLLMISYSITIWKTSWIKCI